MVSPPNISPLKNPMVFFAEASTIMKCLIYFFILLDFDRIISYIFRRFRKGVYCQGQIYRLLAVTLQGHSERLLVVHIHRRNIEDYLQFVHVWICPA